MGLEQVSTEQLTEEAAKKRLIDDSIAIMQDYKKGSERIEQRYIENEQWFKSRHWEYIRQAKFSSDPEPVTGYLLSTLSNKHADFMDFYPSANALPREADDEAESEMLSKILPVEFEYNDFRDTWDKHIWEKLKHGCGIYAVLFDPDGADGIGSGVIKEVDGLNILHQPGINDINESGSVFVTQIIDNTRLKEDYPDINLAKAGKVFEPKQYVTDDTIDLSDSSLIIDRYYHKRSELTGRKILHLVKFVGDYLIYASETDQTVLTDGRMRKDVGIYAHGKFPFLFDNLFPEKNNIRGFGMIDVARNPQLYIDKLDQIIVRNAFTTGRKRFFVKESSNINEEELMDISKDIIHVAGNLNEDYIREWTTDSIAADISNHRIQKIDEIKDVTSTNEFSRGESASGVTAASAIIALQKASGKVSRDQIAKSYNVFKKAVYIYVDIIREFYDIERPYRIKQDGQNQFVKYSNANIKEQQLPQVQGLEMAYRKPIFDIEIIPERQDPFSQAAHNELAKELFTLGVFNPDMYPAARVVLEMMQFDGKEKVETMLQENDAIMQQIQQLAMENQKLMAIVEGLSGEDLGMGVANGTGQANQM